MATVPAHYAIVMDKATEMDPLCEVEMDGLDMIISFVDRDALKRFRLSGVYKMYQFGVRLKMASG